MNENRHRWLRPDTCFLQPRRHFWLLSQLKQVSFAGDVSTQTIALAMAILLVIVFGVSFLVEKTIDLFLGLGPVVTIVAAVALIQGLLIGLRITDHHGLLNLLGG